MRQIYDELNFNSTILDVCSDKNVQARVSLRRVVGCCWENMCDSKQ